jgi:protein involved in polysaccharide export with SLBB domain
MARPKEASMHGLTVLLVLAAVTHWSLPASYAQSTKAGDQNTYFIQGAVKNPGPYRIDGAPSLLKLITLSGGLADNHGAAAFVLRRSPAQPADQERRFKIISVRINELLKDPPDQTETLEPGDIVNIPQTDVFFVVEGQSMVSFPFIGGETLLQALSRVRAHTPAAKPHNAVIFRQDRITGQRQEIRVDLDAVESGKQKDIPLIPNDTIVVTTGRARTVPRLRDIPPIRSLITCAGSGPCLALAR